MHIRELKIQDASRMLEWMHDEDIVPLLRNNFMNKTEDDCRGFIENSVHDGVNLHWCVADDEDIYLGTVSLKSIHDGYAEFAICLHKSAMGTGVAAIAMREILNYGFTKGNLHTIFWCVSSQKRRALRFYDKNHYSRINILGNEDIIKEAKWGGTPNRRSSPISGLWSRDNGAFNCSRKGGIR